MSNPAVLSVYQQALHQIISRAAGTNELPLATFSHGFVDKHGNIVLLVNANGVLVDASGAEILIEGSAIQISNVVGLQSELDNISNHLTTHDTEITTINTAVTVTLPNDISITNSNVSDLESTISTYGNAVHRNVGTTMGTLPDGADPRFTQIVHVASFPVSPIQLAYNQTLIYATAVDGQTKSIEIDQGSDGMLVWVAINGAGSTGGSITITDGGTFSTTVASLRSGDYGFLSLAHTNGAWNKNSLFVNGSGVGSIPFSSITGKPTTLSGYGISDGQPLDATLTGLSGKPTTGSGSVVLSTSPTLATPSLGSATISTLNGLSISSATGNTLAIATGKTLTISSTLILSGNDGATLSIGSGVALSAIGAGTWAGANTITTLGTVTSGTWNAAVVAGQYGGTGVNNTGKTITLGGNISTTGVLSIGANSAGTAVNDGSGSVSWANEATFKTLNHLTIGTDIPVFNTADVRQWYLPNTFGAINAGNGFTFSVIGDSVADHISSMVSTLWEWFPNAGGSNGAAFSTFAGGAALDGYNAVRTVTDGVINNTTTVTSATANFFWDDVGSTISGTGIPGGATIVSVTNATTVTISSAATSSSTGVSLTVTNLNFPKDTSSTFPVWNAAIFRVPSGGTVTFPGISAQAPYDTVKIFAYKEPSAGSFKAQLSTDNGSTWSDIVSIGTVSLSNSSTLIMVVSATFAAGPSNRVRIVGVSGFCRFAPPLLYSSSNKGVISYGFSSPGTLLSDFVTLPTAIVGPVISTVAPHFMVLCIKDSPSAVLVSIPQMENLFSVYSPNTDIIYELTTQVVGGGMIDGMTAQQATIAQNNNMIAIASTYNRTVVDDFAVFGNPSNAQAIGWLSGDGIHPTSTGDNVLTWNRMKQLGMFNMPSLNPSNLRQLTVSGQTSTQTLNITETSADALALNINSGNIYFGGHGSLTLGNDGVGSKALILYDSTQSENNPSGAWLVQNTGSTLFFADQFSTQWNMGFASFFPTRSTDTIGTTTKPVGGLYLNSALPTSHAGAIGYNGTNFQGYNGSAWIRLDVISAADLVGVLGASHGGAGTTNGVLKADGAGNVSAASSGSDIITPATFWPGCTKIQQNSGALMASPASSFGNAFAALYGFWRKDWSGGGVAAHSSWMLDFGPLPPINSNSGILTFFDYANNAGSGTYRIDGAGGSGVISVNGTPAILVMANPSLTASGSITVADGDTITDGSGASALAIAGTGATLSFRWLNGTQWFVSGNTISVNGVSSGKTVSAAGSFTSATTNAVAFYWGNSGTSAFSTGNQYGICLVNWLGGAIYPSVKIEA